MDLLKIGTILQHKQIGEINMASVKIIKGSLRNVVDEVQFEKLYKPNGWRLDEDAVSKIEESEEVKAVKNFKTENNLHEVNKKERDTEGVR